MAAPMQVPEVRRERVSFTVQGPDLEAIRLLVIERLHEIDAWCGWVVTDMHLYAFTGTAWQCDVEAEAHDRREERPTPRRWFRRWT